KLEVPAGVSSLDVRFDMLTPTAGNEGRVVMTHDMLNVQWGTVALYPSGYQAGNIAVTPSLVLTSGWQAGTALALPQRQGETQRHGTVSCEVLRDSPVYAGRHFKRVDLDPGADTPVMLDIVADAPKYLEYDEEQIEAHRALVDQAYKLFD